MCLYQDLGFRKSYGLSHFVKLPLASSVTINQANESPVLFNVITIRFNLRFSKLKNSTLDPGMKETFHQRKSIFASCNFGPEKTVSGQDDRRDFFNVFAKLLTFLSTIAE